MHVKILPPPSALYMHLATEGGGSECNNGAVIGIAVSALIVISALIIVIIILLVKMQRYKKYVVHNYIIYVLVTIQCTQISTL